MRHSPHITQRLGNACRSIATEQPKRKARKEWNYHFRSAEFIEPAILSLPVDPRLSHPPRHKSFDCLTLREFGGCSVPPSVYYFPNSTLHTADLLDLFPLPMPETKRRAPKSIPTPVPASPAAVEKTILLKTSTTYDGAKIAYPLVGQAELTFVRFVIPPDAILSEHTHPMPCFGYVLNGSITIVNGGEQHTFWQGDIIPEVVDMPHFGIAGNDGCVLIVTYTGCVGQPLMEPYNEDEVGSKVRRKHSISESTIASILDSCDIDTILESFKTLFSVLGGTTWEIENEYAVVRKLILSDLDARLQRDPAVHGEQDFVLRDLAFRALLLYRISHALWSPQYVKYTGAEAHNAKCVALDLHNFAKRYWIDIHPGASIQRGLYLDHALGVKILNGVVIGENCGILHSVYIGDIHPTVIGEQASVGNNCTIKGGVLLGAYIKPNPLVQETERVRGRRHPVIGDNCFLSPGVQVVGPVSVADDAFIPMGTLVTRDYPAKHQ